jgi:cysteine desulfurase
VEHPATTAPAAFLERLGYEVTIVQADREGIVRPAAVERALRKNTRLVSVMHANNETGIVQPIREIAEVCHARGIPLHTDAAQTVGKLPVQCDQLDVDLLSIAGHKFYGPKGTGALFVREGLDLEPALHGASQESGLRPGTENTAGIVGLGKASALAARALGETTDRMAQLRDMLQQRLVAAVGPELLVSGAQVERLPNTLHLVWPGIDAHQLLRQCPEICASTGAACHGNSTAVSGSIACLGINAEQARGAMRLSLGWYTSGEDIDFAGDLLIAAWERATA